MNKYNQITVENRYHIYAYKKAGFCVAEQITTYDNVDPDYPFEAYL